MGAFQIEDLSVCDDLVALCESGDRMMLEPGIVGRGGVPTVDTRSKQSLEMSFLPNDKREEWRRYITALQVSE